MIVAPTACMKLQRLASPADEWAWAAEGIREGGQYAATVGVNLTLECWNRYETYFLNRLEQGVETVREIDSRSWGSWATRST